MSICYFDFETRSPTPISQGLDNYSAKAEAMLLSWCVDDGPPQLWDIMRDPKMPAAFEAVLADPECILIAHNCQFDMTILQRCLGRYVDLRRFRCTAAQARAHALPASLEMVGIALGLSEEERKLSDGKALIQLFCVPRDYTPNGSPLWNDRHSHPAEWLKFSEYAIQDTATLRTIHRKLPSHNYQGDHLRMWHLDQLINTRGFGFDDELAIAASKILTDGKDVKDRQAYWSTDGAVSAPTQRAKLLAWFNTCGLEIPDLKAATIREHLEADDLRPEIRFMLELRLEAAKSSGSKYTRGLTMVGAGKRIRHALQYGGAGRTGRFSGKGFQPHNCPRAKVKFLQVEQEIAALKGGYLDLLT